MGSAPSTNQKVLVGVQQIKTPQTQHHQNQDFNSSVEQMKVFNSLTKFSKRNDIFKEKSHETQMELRNALQNLKKNLLLSTGQFKKLHKTDNLINGKPQKGPKTIKGQRYEYRPNGNKFSQNNLTIKRKNQSFSSKQMSSVSSTHINEGKQSNQLSQIPPSIKLQNVNPSVETQVLNHLLNRKKNANSQNTNRQYRNILENNQAELIVDFETKYENGKLGQGKKKPKYIKSQKFIPLKLGVMNEQEVPSYSFDKELSPIE